MYVKRYISEDTTSFAITAAFRHVPREQNKLVEKGEMNGLISISAQDGVDVNQISKFVWEKIVDVYFFEEKGSVVDSLKKAISEGSKRVVELMKNGTDDKTQEINLSFALAVIKDKTAYLGVFGEEQIFIYKNRDFVKISEIITQNKGVVASIAISDDDIILISSTSLLDAFSEIAEKGASPFELVNQLDLFCQNLSGNQSLLLVARRDLQVTQAGDREVEAPKIEEKIIEKKEEREEDKREDEKVVVSKRPFLSRIKAEQKLSSITFFFKRVFRFLYTIFGKIGTFFRNIVMRVTGRFGDVYGRKMWFKKLLSQISLKRLKKGGVKGFTIDGYKIKNLRNKRFFILLLAVVILGLIFGGVKLGIKAKEAREMHQFAAPILESTQSYLEDAEKTIVSEREAAETAVFEAGNQLTQLEGKDLSVDDEILYSQLRAKWQSLDDRINKRQILSEENENIEIWLDGRVSFGESTQLTDVVGYKDDLQNEFLFVVDRGNAKAYRISMYDKSITTIPDAKNILTSPMYVDYGNSGVYIYDEAKGVVKASFTKSGLGNLGELSGLSAEETGGNSVKDLLIFGTTDNVYLLNTLRESVQKSIRSGGGYGLPYDYINSDSFALGTNILGDISIYVLTPTGGVERFSYNYVKKEMRSNPLTIEGMTESLIEPKAAYNSVSPEAGMFVFDASAKKIVAMEKPKESGGNILHPNELLVTAQYVYRGIRDDAFSNVSDIATDYNENYLFIVDSNRIWRVKLN